MRGLVPMWLAASTLLLGYRCEWLAGRSFQMAILLSHFPFPASVESRTTPAKSELTLNFFYVSLSFRKRCTTSLSLENFVASVPIVLSLALCSVSQGQKRSMQIWATLEQVGQGLQICLSDECCFSQLHIDRVIGLPNHSPIWRVVTLQADGATRSKFPSWWSHSFLNCWPHMGVSKDRGNPKMDGLLMESTIRMDDLGVPLFSETSISFPKYLHTSHRSDFYGLVLPGLALSNLAISGTSSGHRSRS